MIRTFIEKYPDITVELSFDEHQSDIVGNGFDAGIRLSDILAEDIAAIKLAGPLRFVTAASPAYLNKHGRPKHPRDLLHHDCIRARITARLYDHWEFEHKGEEFEVQVKGSLILNDPVMTEDAAVRGAGIIYTLEDAIKPRVERGELEIVLSQYASTSTGFYLYYPKPSQVLPKLRALIDHIKMKRRAGDT